MLLKFLILFFAIGTVVSLVKKDLPMVLYFLGATLLNVGVMIK